MSSPCGCSSSSAIPYSAPVYTSEIPCTNGTPCDEAIKLECVKYVGPNLPTLGVTNGMFLKDALAALNFALTSSMVTKTYTITVTGVQTITTVEYINASGAVTKISVGLDQSPQTICAQEDSPVKLSGTGVLSAAITTC